MILLWCAVAAALAAWFWRAWGTAYLQRHVVFASDVQSNALVISGPFRYVRNPLYLGNLFLALAVAVFASPVGLVIILAGNIVAALAFAGAEAQQLAQRYGAAYEAFRSAVPAFIPRLTPAPTRAGGAVKGAWRAAIFGEAFCFALAVAIVPVALFGQAGFTAFWIIWISALLLFGISGRLAGRANGSPPKR